MIISNKDRRKLVSLLERYGYEKMTQFNVLNESFKSNILTTLEKINSRPHMGLSDADGKRLEAALSPVGAAFMKAFPIPWHLITDDQIKIYYNGNLSKQMSQYGELTNNMINLSKNKKYAEDYKRVRTNGYVTDSSLGGAQKNINTLRKQIGRSIDNIITANTEFANSIGQKNIGEERDNIWVASTKKLAEKYRDNKKGAVNDYLILTTLYRFLDRVANDAPYTKPEKDDKETDSLYNKYTNIDDLTENYKEFKTEGAKKIVDTARFLYSQFVSKDGTDVTRYGITGAFRIKGTDADNYMNRKEMITANAYQILNPLVEKGIITNFDIDVFLRKNYNGNLVVEDIKGFFEQFRKYYIDRCANLGEEYTNKEIGEIEKIIKDEYKDINNRKKGNKDEYDILHNLYDNGIKLGDNNKALVSKLTDLMQEWYEDFKNNICKYSLAVLTDKNYRILYVFSCISFNNDYPLGYKVDSKAIYGWKIGDSAEKVEYELSGLDSKAGGMESEDIKDESGNIKHVIKVKRRSGEKTIYNYNKIDIETIKRDKNLACAIVISDNGKYDENTPASLEDYNETILHYLKDSNIENDATFAYSDDNKIETSASNVKRIENLLKSHGIKYTEKEGKMGRREFIFKIDGENAKEDITKVCDLLNGGNPNTLKQVVEYFMDAYDAKMSFDPKFKKPKDFGIYYDNVLNKDDIPYDEGDITSELKKAFEEYESSNKTLYQCYIGNKTDSEDKRILFDSYMKKPHYRNIVREYNDAKWQLQTFLNTTSNDVVFNFDIKNKPGVIFAEQIRRLNREGRVRNFDKNNISEVDELLNNINNLKVFTNGSALFTYLSENISRYPKYPFKTKSEECKWDLVKKKVRYAIHHLRSNMNNINTSSENKQIYLDIAKSMYTDFVNLIQDISQNVRFGNKDEGIDYIANKLMDFYYNGYYEDASNKKYYYIDAFNQRLIL